MVLMEVVVIQQTKNFPSLVTFALSILPSRSMFSSTRSSTEVSSSASFGVLETDMSFSLSIGSKLMNLFFLPQTLEMADKVTQQIVLVVRVVVEDWVVTQNTLGARDLWGSILVNDNQNENKNNETEKIELGYIVGVRIPDPKFSYQPTQNMLHYFWQTQDLQKTKIILNCL